MNNAIKQFIPLLLTILMASGTIFGVCTEDEQKIIAQKTPYELYGSIDRAKNAMLKEGSLLKNGFNQKELKQWDQLIECCHMITAALIEKNEAPQNYNQYRAQLNKTTDFIKNTVALLHKKYASLLDNKESLIEKINQRIKTDLRQENLNSLASIKQEINNHTKMLSTIIGATLKKINNEIATPDEWKLGIPKTIDAILPCYKDFFNSYYTAKKRSSNQQLTSRELIYFLNITKIFKSNCLKNVHYSDTAKAAALVDVLEKLNYILEEDIKKSNFNKARKKMLSASKEMIEKLESHYPEMITEVYFKKLPLSKDKASVMLFAEVKALISVLESLTNEVNQIIIKGTKKGVPREE